MVQNLNQALFFFIFFHHKTSVSAVNDTCLRHIALRLNSFIAVLSGIRQDEILPSLPPEQAAEQARQRLV